MTAIPKPFKNQNLSALPTSNPGGNKPWRFAGATGWQVVVGAFTPAGVTDHGALTGLADDDHPQYFNQTRGDVRYFQKTGGVVNGFIEATSYIDAANIRCDGSTVFDTSGASLNIGNTGGFTSATLLQGASGISIVRLGGGNASFPAIKQVGPSIQCKLADDSAYTEVVVDTLKFGSTNTFIGTYSNAGISVYTAGAVLGTVNCGYTIIAASGYLYFAGRAIFNSSANGVLHVQNYDLNDATADQVLALGPATSASNGVRLKRVMGTTVVNVRNGNDSADASMTMANLTLSGLFGLGTYTVATLPSASANAGKLAEVTDSSVTTYRSTVAGGGSNRVDVKSNGTNWLVN